MKSTTNRILIFAIMLLTGYTSIAQPALRQTIHQQQKQPTMKTSLIEREIPGAVN
jgi:hypothetical protein